MESVIAQFVLNIKKEHDTAGHPYRQPSDIDDRIAFMSLDVSQSGLQIISQHSCVPQSFFKAKIMPFQATGSMKEKHRRRGLKVFEMATESVHQRTKKKRGKFDIHGLSGLN
jgi:hypothetical protein